MRSRVLAAVVLIAAPALVHADAALQVFLEQTLAAARDKDHLPAVAALIQIDGKIEAQAALGVRALGHPEPVTVDDRWHIGSDTKAFTSTMIARLVEQGVMGFDDTLAASFPAFAKDMDPAYRSITVTQLLSHTAGLPPLTEDKDLPAFLAVIKTASGVKAQRVAIARQYLTRPPASKAGEFAYSNLGYIIAGAIAEARTGKTWEELIREQVFLPLGITERGIRGAGHIGTVRSAARPPGEGGHADAARSRGRRGRQSAGARPGGHDQHCAQGLDALRTGPPRRRARPRQAAESRHLSQAPYAGDRELRAGLGCEARSRTACR